MNPVDTFDRDGESGYVLGHDAAEQQRLEQQGTNLQSLTRRLLRGAGLVPGMRVLDVGCGAGDVTLIAAELVGSSGMVVGIDRSAEVLGDRPETADWPRLSARAVSRRRCCLVP